MLSKRVGPKKSRNMCPIVYMLVLVWFGHNAIYHEALKRDLMQLIFMFLSRKTEKDVKKLSLDGV